MPTPVELLLDPLSLLFFAIYTALITWEAIAPARQLPTVRYWRTLGLTSFLLYFYLSSYGPLFWNSRLGSLQLFDLTSVAPMLQFCVGLILYELLLYTWHRSMHAYTPLWRSFHQLHHSAERLDTFGAFWFSPLDMLGFTFVGSIALVLVIGIDPVPATAVMMMTFFMGVFQHANVKTPRWLGYIIQRPESHSMHHGKGLHRYNYADLPLIDMVFGTFRNPAEAMETGFYQGASKRILEMLLFRDVYQPKSHAAVSGELEVAQ